MRLFLSSYRAGRYTKELVDLFGQNSHVAVVTNAKDYNSPTDRLRSVTDTMNFVSSLGFEAHELDLRNYFDGLNDWNDYFEDYDAIWLSGGNTFVLRRALTKAGLDKALINLVKEDKIAYGGESAGAIMATPNFTGVQYGDDPDVLPRGYSEPTPWNGLGLVEYCIVPHFHSSWAGAADMEATLRSKSVPYKTLTDEQVIIISGSHQEILG